jgi:putative transposase
MTLMRQMGREALYRRLRITKPEPGHKFYPYLLRGLAVTRPNQVWAMDISYIPMAHGFVHLAVVLDWASRRTLSWRLSITMEAAFCVETLETPWLVTASRRSSIPLRARSSPVQPSPACSPVTASPSAWTAKAPGGTTSSSSGCGAASNTRRSISAPAKPSARHQARLVGISTSTTGDDFIRVLTTAPRIKPTSIFLRSAGRPNPGRRSTYGRGIFVQTTGTGSVGFFLIKRLGQSTVDGYFDVPTLPLSNLP